jgi:hypothetical protein
MSKFFKKLLGFKQLQPITKSNRGAMTNEVADVAAWHSGRRNRAILRFRTKLSEAIGVGPQTVLPTAEPDRRPSLSQPQTVRTYSRLVPCRNVRILLKALRPRLRSKPPKRYKPSTRLSGTLRSFKLGRILPPHAGLDGHHSPAHAFGVITARPCSQPLRHLPTSR